MKSVVEIPIAAISDQFAISGTFLHSEEIPTGHINSTYRVTYQEDNGEQRRYILQAINRHVFKDPYAVMRNVETVTRHINQRVLREKSDLSGQTLNLFPARSGALWVEDVEQRVWRCYNAIEGCRTYDIVENERQAWQAAHAFGSFQHLVSDLDSSRIVETIPDFHHTRKRFDRLIAVATIDPCDRLSSVQPELRQILDLEPMVDVLLDLAAAGKIPTRITHNDTKINNVMIDSATDEAVCVIDLDTVMPGLSLYDFGDMVRSATNSAGESETDLSKVEMRLPIYQALVDGYLAAAGDFLNETEIQHLAFSGKLLTLEVAIRFLTDYLEGDIYFKTTRPGQNLDRTRNQLQLLKTMECGSPLPP
ncbi:MAG: aminoglycoside phosphotransferase family protein [Luteolibacter sp.]